jgi:tRNA-2-methylthio-N6-dimethylallyladenosine synthase
VAFRYLVQTFGCQMNVHDSRCIEDVLQASGGSLAAGVQDADLVVFNTCSVREKAEQKLRSEVGKLAVVKLSRPGLVVAVAGCVATQEAERLLARIRHIDLVVGPDNIPELPALVMEQLAGAPPVVRTQHDLAAPRFLTASPRPGEAPVVAFVTTMKGCDERCTFCVVPYTRGPERYRPAQEIVDEAKRFVLAGSREILLLGQTVNSFRDAELATVQSTAQRSAPQEAGESGESQFAQLLRLIAAEVPRYDPEHPEAPGLVRLRYTSPHPRHVTESLVRAHAELDVLARHVHLPVQSGSDRVLRRMLRRYTRAEYLQRARRLTLARPGLTLSTDVIVGFPGETEEDFADTLSLVREVGFVSLFAFTYSPRPHTPALRLADDIAESLKRERLARLFETANTMAAAYLSTLVGTRQWVLVEGPSKSEAGKGETRAFAAARVQGRTERNEIVHVQGPEVRSLVGQLVEVEITQAHGHSLAGTAAGTARRAARSATGAGAAARDPSRRAPSPARSLPLVTEAGPHD